MPFSEDFTSKALDFIFKDSRIVDLINLLSGIYVVLIIIALLLSLKYIISFLGWVFKNYFDIY